MTNLTQNNYKINFLEYISAVVFVSFDVSGKFFHHDGKKLFNQEFRSSVIVARFGIIVKIVIIIVVVEK